MGMLAQVRGIIFWTADTCIMCAVWKNFPCANCSCRNGCLCLTVSAGAMAVRLGHILHNAVKYIFQVWNLPQGIKMFAPRHTTNACCWSPPAGKESTCWEHIVREAFFFFLRSHPLQPTSADKPLQSISDFLDEWENNRWDQSRWPCKLSLCYIYANEQHWWRSRCWYVKEKWTASKMIRLGNEPEPECLPGRCYSSDSLWQLQN